MLMNAQFNDAILLFSDLPDIRIDEVVVVAWKLYKSVPAGVTHRENSSESRRQNTSFGFPVHSWEKPNYLDCAAPYIYSSDLKKLISNNQVLMIDLRSDFLHNRLSIPGSLCCAFEANEYTLTAFQGTVGNAVDLALNNGHTVCLIDVHPFNNAVKASWDLIRAGKNKICIYADDLSKAFN
uniref:Rhodanese domain-containing protein n=2 Tax=Bursaphelenchus xylophilus TaxID=6326 RepID=A0A1I7RZU3_BURXY